MALVAFPVSRIVSAIRSTSIVTQLVAVVALAAPLGACSMFDDINPFGPEKYKTKIEPDVAPLSMYDQGLARLKKGDDDGAAKKFVELGKQYPYTDWSKKGLLMTTYAQYQGGDYDNAEQSAEHYAKLYPDTSDTAYALYLEAMSYYNQIPDISRDQERSGKALALFQQIVDKFPNSEYVDNSKFKIKSPATSSRARKCRSAGSISIDAIIRRRSTGSAMSSPTIRRAAIPRRPCIA